MDIERPDLLRRKRRLRWGVGTAVLFAAIGLITLLGTWGIAAPSVERERVWIERVQRGEMLREARAQGVLPPQLGAMIDPDQVEQALINLLHNAADACAETGGAILVRADDTIAVQILDEGTGLAAVENLFVPFFTTKPQGCGIGLFVAR